MAAKDMSPDVYSKRFALRIAAMIDTRLIWYKHYFRWAHQLIAQLDNPPLWILQIATIKYYPNALAAVNRFVYAEPFESFDGEQYDEEYLACLFLRYQSGAISWATFLNEAGSFTDASCSRFACEYFYAFLNELEDNEYAQNLESRQSAEIEFKINAAIHTIRPLYKMFIEYLREYVANQK